MKDVTSLLRQYEPLVKHTVANYMTTYDSSRHVNQFEDFMQEGRIAAFKAIETHNDNHNTKLSTYIVNCIANRMRDLHRRSTSQKNTPLHFEEPATLSIISDSNQEEENHQYTEVETFHSLDSYLNSRQSEFLRKIIVEECRSMNDLMAYADLLRSKKDGETDRKHRTEMKREVGKCLSLAQRALQLNEKSQKTLTSPKLKQSSNAGTG